MRRGFTLIELLVSISIMMLILGGGLVAYIRFNDRQTLVSGGKQLQSYLRTAQKKARVGDLPPGCVTLEYYELQLVANANTVAISAHCKDGNVSSDIPVLSDELPNGVTSVTAADLRFLVLKGGVENTQVLRLTNGTLQYEVTVTGGGEISHGEVVNGNN